MKHKYLLVSLVAGLICLSVVGYGDDLSALRLKAEQGNANAQYNIGVRYANGKGVDQDQQEAVKWYRLAAEQGYASAQQVLGRRCAIGKGVQQDQQEAVKWYRLAAEQGNAIAQYRLGFCYNFGHGVSRDYAVAVKWYQRAADQGYSAAQSYLGLCYYHGNGVDKNIDDAIKWFRMGAEGGHYLGQYWLGRCYFTGEGVQQDYSTSLEWFRPSAEHGFHAALYYLGYCYYYGKGVAADYDEARKWLGVAAEKGNQPAKALMDKIQNNSVAKNGTQSSEISPNSIQSDVVKNIEKQGRQVEVNISAADIIAHSDQRKRFAAIYGNASFPSIAGDPELYSRCLKYFAATYDRLSEIDFVVKSLKKPDLDFKQYASASGWTSYLSALDQFLQETTQDSSRSSVDMTLTMRDGTQIKVDKPMTSDAAAVYYKNGQESIRVPLSELTPVSQNAAQIAIADYSFKLNCELSVDDYKGREQKEWIESSPSEYTKQWFEDEGNSYQDWLRDAGEKRSHKQYQYDVLISNRSDISIDSLIVEYQVFFRQEVAGMPDNMHKYYRFVGYSTISSIEARDNYRLTIRPPYITESHLVSTSTTDGSYEYNYDLSYPKGCHQESSGRMQGIWVRVHRISDNGCITVEKKKNIYPSRTTWDAIGPL